jgi:hypothetical protein
MDRSTNQSYTTYIYVVSYGVYNIGTSVLLITPYYINNPLSTFPPNSVHLQCPLAMDKISITICGDGGCGMLEPSLVWEYPVSASRGHSGFRAIEI